MQIVIPALETTRLRLVPPEANHLQPWNAIYSDPEVMRHVGEPQDIGKTWDMLARVIGHWFLRGFGGWSVQEKETGAIIGRVGLMYPEGNPAVEIGWVFARETWGKGYASEAGRAALDYAFDVVKAPRVIARVYTGNAGSIAVAKKLGMVVDESASKPDDLILHIMNPAA
jgi:RimJ/RimL family protein N-acetyltransferase